MLIHFSVLSTLERYLPGLQVLQIGVNKDHRLQPGTLPAGLQVLTIDVGDDEADYFDDKPMEIGTLPFGLKKTHIRRRFQPAH